MMLMDRICLLICNSSWFGIDFGHTIMSEFQEFLKWCLHHSIVNQWVWYYTDMLVISIIYRAIDAGLQRLRFDEL